MVILLHCRRNLLITWWIKFYDALVDLRPIGIRSIVITYKSPNISVYAIFINFFINFIETSGINGAKMALGKTFANDRMERQSTVEKSRSNLIENETETGLLERSLCFEYTSCGRGYVRYGGP